MQQAESLVEEEAAAPIVLVGKALGARCLVELGGDEAALPATVKAGVAFSFPLSKGKKVRGGGERRVRAPPPAAPPHQHTPRPPPRR